MSDAGREIRALTGVRAAAAVWVLLYHLRDDLFVLCPALRPLDGLFSVGYLGVDVFFVLSGFILSLNYTDAFAEVRPGAYLAFLRKRLARIYPVHLFTLSLLAAAFGLGLSVSSDPHSHDRVDLLLNLLLVHDWADRLSWNLVSWSISAEWFAYLLFPWAAGRIGRIPSAALAWMGAALAFAGMEILFAVFFPGSGGTTAHGGLIRVSGEFFAGCFLARVHRLAPPPEWAARLAAPAICAFVASWALVGKPSPLVVALFGPLVLALAGSTGGLSGLLASRPLVYGGRISYSLYMTHAIFISRFRSLFPPARWAGAALPARVGLIALELGVAWLVADLTFRLVEEPCRRWLSARQGRTGLAVST